MEDSEDSTLILKLIGKLKNFQGIEAYSGDGILRGFHFFIFFKLLAKLDYTQRTRAYSGIEYLDSSIFCKIDS